MMWPQLYFMYDLIVPRRLVDTVPTKVCAFCGPQPHGKPCRVVLCATPESTSCALVSWEVGKVWGAGRCKKWAVDLSRPLWNLFLDDSIPLNSRKILLTQMEWISFSYWCLVGNGCEWGNGMITTSDYGSFPHSLLSTSKFILGGRSTVGACQKSSPENRKLLVRLTVNSNGFSRFGMPSNCRCISSMNIDGNDYGTMLT